MEAGHSSESSIGCAGRFFGICWTAFSSIFLCFGLWMTWGALEAWKWESVPCVIDRFEIVADQKKDPAFRADLAYRYKVDGREYTGTRLWKEDKGSDKYEELAKVREQLAQGPEGSLANLTNVQTECRVKPGEPETSALMPSGSGQIWGGLIFAAFGGFFVLIGIGLIFGGTGKSAKTVSKKGGTENFFAAVMAFLFFGCAGLGLLFGLIIPKAAEWVAMRGWQETEAEVIWSRVRSKSDSDGTTYAVDLFYRYQVDGREYRSNRYDLLGGSSSGSKGKHEVTRAHPPESKLTVFVDPDEPWRAVVKRSAGWWGLFALFPLPFIAVGAGGLWTIFKKRREGASVSLPRSSGKGAAVRAHRIAAKSLEPGKWTRAGSSRIGGFIGLTVFALFWNGFLFFFQRSLWGDVGSGDGFGKAIGGVFTLFMIPFFLIGIGLAVGVVYAFASLFAPRFEIQLAAGDLKPGRSVRLQWRRAGGRGQPKDFALLLVGREEATYSQGSSNSTARSVFHEEVLFETTIPQAMEAGSVSLKIPDDAVPTFNGTHNRIVWRACLHAKVPWLPDARDEREILVLPFDATELP
ncbi:DUF3592 domain-containing protein [Luteolibacter arcticus]|uniref:DUF3592 domain-containing protein n=1 Tax=Luteolibacter arcticus TaxID=1581411 RepID=A0ABT3GFI2_9BACT|nr:DUF3592 domain-containing protein [Luteolibacter arcticus]MCW1922376.1 DUF3592 domain-containing protein [Luteolibacter arcticus]